MFFFFKQKTAYEMRISDWSSDVCSSDLLSVSTLQARYGTTDTKEEFWATWREENADHERDTIYDIVNEPLDKEKKQIILQDREKWEVDKIGRASWRERVCQDV